MHCLPVALIPTSAILSDGGAAADVGAVLSQFLLQCVHEGSYQCLAWHVQTRPPLSVVHIDTQPGSKVDMSYIADLVCDGYY